MLAAAERSLFPLGKRLLPACAAALPKLAAPPAAAAATAAQAAAAALPPCSSTSCLHHPWAQIKAQWRQSSSSSSSTAGSGEQLAAAGSSSTSAAGAALAPERGASNLQHHQLGQAEQQQQQQQQHTAAYAAGEGAEHPSYAASGYDRSPFPEHDEAEEEGAAARRRRHDDEQFRQQRQRLLAAALAHVPRLGWVGGGAAAAGAEELGLSPAAAGMLGSDAQLVQLFFADCNQRLEADLAGRQAELEGMEVRERVRLGVRLRLEMLEPYIASWPQALSLLAQPAAAPHTLQLYAELADAIWHAAGDTSTDLSWYTKRALLTGVYSASELYMITDSSPGFADTWAALERRVEDAFQLGAAAEEAGTLAGAVSGAAGALAAQLGGVLRRGG